MDNDTRDALLTLNASLAIIARRQTEQGEMLALMVKLLTPDQASEEGPSLQELVEQILKSIQSAAIQQAAAIRDLGTIVQRIPAEAGRAVDEKIQHLAKNRP